MTRLRALVVLPTRDLVLQVRDVFEQFSRGTGLKIGTATGQHSFAHEQSNLVGLAPPDSPTSYGGNSKIDILICTPGRLMDHLKLTKGFSLQHLRYLVIDEADRLLNQSFNDWLKTILSHIELTTSDSMDDVDDLDEDAKPCSTTLSQPDAVAPALVQRRYPMPRSDLDVKLKPSVRDSSRIQATCVDDPYYRPRSCFSQLR